MTGRKYMVSGLALLALLLSACGTVKTPRSEADPAPQSGVVGPQAPTSWQPETQHEAFGQTIFDPPPAGATPAHTFLEAFNLCLAADATQAKCGSGVPTVKLALFSDNTHGHVQPDGSVKLSYQGLLVWWMRWTGQLCPNAGGGGLGIDPQTHERVKPTETPSVLRVCRLDTIIEATTNTYLEAYSF